MAGYLTSVVLEFSEDPLSDTTPTWTDVTVPYLMDVEWWAGNDSEAQEPQPGGCVLRLKNVNRDFEPLYEAGRFYPNITTGRRFRLTVNGVQQGVWYAQNFELEYPADTDYSIVTITCGDGFDVLALDDLPTMDPPDADTYEDVVSSDEPWGYWRLGEPEGTRARANLVGNRFTRMANKKVRRRLRPARRGSRYSTAAEVGAVSGPAGSYKNTPSLGAEGLILGDRDTAVVFTRASSEYVRVDLDEDTFDSGSRSLTLECWVKFNTLGIDQYLITGPAENSGAPIFFMHVNSSNFLRAGIESPAGTISTSYSAPGFGTTDPHHVVVVFGSGFFEFYVDGTLGIRQDGETNPMDVPAAGPEIYFGRSISGDFLDGTLDEVAIYEYGLSAERIAAHYEAGTARGWPMQTAGERIADIATHALWSEASIQTTGLDVMPQFQHGQGRVDEIAEVAHAEGYQPLVFFNGSGNPVYLGYEFMATDANYNTVQYTFGDGPGEVPCHVQIVYDNETFNDVIVSHESGELAQATDATAEGERGRRANQEWTDILLMEHGDVVNLAQQILDFYKEPAMRPATLDVNGAKALTQILDLGIGHLIRVKKRGEGGTPIDRVCRILGYRKRIDSDEHLTCSYSLARGFNGADGYWHLGVQGFSNLGTSTVLG